MKTRHVDESSHGTKQQLYWQSIHATVNITKLRNFLCSFSLKFPLFKQGSLAFCLVEVRTNIKVFNVVFVIKIENANQIKYDCFFFSHGTENTKKYFLKI